MAWILANAGFAVYGIDYEGHGRSAGKQGCIEKIDNLVDDCFNHFMTLCASEKEENNGKKRFLLGDTMGGAVSLLLHMKKPGFWHGAVLVSPFSRVADPARLAIKILSKLSNCIPQSKSTATYDLINMAIRDPENIKKVRFHCHFCFCKAKRTK
ncbi:monoacylglycerol lipase-like isoform X1 [Tripterygium wilfordii]|uniref:monoacylglycerol lipase-like isoform X1 n=1 Tax=Tripterygium wilfordii TaxID=458696 RepID=UPI0018F83673|nr:monoacylglycerol lipase-like isoform X1 [Tripterygium wilfordii]